MCPPCDIFLRSGAIQTSATPWDEIFISEKAGCALPNQSRYNESGSKDIYHE
jgi:hypothetical protein